MPSIDPRDSLSRTLADWRVSPPRSPQFRAQVWERIAAAKHSLPWSRYVRVHAAAVGGVLALAVVLGVVSGQGQARARATADRAQLAAQYVQTYDARSMHLVR